LKKTFIIVLFLLIFQIGCKSEKYANDIPNIISEDIALPKTLLLSETTEFIPKDDYFEYQFGFSQSILDESGVEAGKVKFYVYRFFWEDGKLFNALSFVESQEGIITFETPDIGEIVASNKGENNGYPYINLVFTRCKTLVSIHMSSTIEYELLGSDMIEYASWIDEILQKKFCG
jgi:hypothetical protein